MNELLKRLTELDPELCQLSGFGIFTIAGRGICADFTYSHVGTYIYERDLVLAWVEYATQRAIMARGWRFGIQLYSGFQVWVAAPNSRYCWATNADNLTTALLTAYVQALMKGNES